MLKWRRRGREGRREREQRLEVAHALLHLQLEHLVQVAEGAARFLDGRELVDVMAAVRVRSGLLLLALALVLEVP